MTRRIFCRILLVVVAILGLFVLSSVAARGNRDTAFERVKAVQEAHTNRLMAIKDVEGTAIGLDRNDQPAVKVFTAGPGVRGIPKTLDGVAVEVVVTGKIYALADPTARYDRPVPTGVSTGHPDITAGTIGCRVKDVDGNVYALSNNHVYANENLASIGDNVLQPGAYDGGVNPGDAIGTLADFEPIVFKRRARNEIDAAIALTNTNLVGTATPDDGYGVPNSETVGAFVGKKVKKFGRTTGLTQGEITGVNATVTVGYGSGKTARFVKQIIIEPGDYSAGGDSGSLIVTDDDNLNPVGLLFAGSSTLTVANRIDLVLQRFGVTVDNTTAGEPPVLTTIEVSPISATIEEGQTQQFTAIGSFDDGSTADLASTATWASSNTDVATVDASGLATGILAGTTSITATQDGIPSDAAALDVTPATATDTVTITKAEYKLRNGELNVEATSTGAPDAVLTVYDSTGAVNYGQMTYDAKKDKYKFKKRGVTDPGGFVMVISSLGDSATKTVKHK
ncbi:MAG: Ig-like domain-containing protein [Planctomycetes bacterium]|nr:Ig-like domain-containing protein [Planctomycetota bacterium]